MIKLRSLIETNNPRIYDIKAVLRLGLIAYITAGGKYISKKRPKVQERHPHLIM